MSVTINDIFKTDYWISPRGIIVVMELQTIPRGVPALGHKGFQMISGAVGNDEVVNVLAPVWISEREAVSPITGTRHG